MRVDDYAMIILNPGDFEIPDIIQNDVCAAETDLRVPDL